MHPRVPGKAGDGSSIAKLQTAKGKADFRSIRVRRLQVAYGRALGTAAKVCLEQYEEMVSGHQDFSAQALEHLVKAVKVMSRRR